MEAQLEQHLERALEIVRSLQNGSSPSMSFGEIDERVALINSILAGETDVQEMNALVEYREGKFVIQPCSMKDALVEMGVVTVLGSGTYGTASKVCLPNDCKLSFAMKEIEYSDDPEYSDPTHPDRPENIEARCLQLLSEFVLAGQTPHINLYMMDFMCMLPKPIKYIFSELADGTAFDLVKQIPFLSEDNLDGTDWFMKTPRAGGDKYFANRKTGESTDDPPLNPDLPNVILWYKVFFFQIISVMATIFAKYPSFKHNDMHVNNILFSRTSPDQKTDFHPPKDKPYKYTIGGESFIVPDVGFQLKLWDFDSASLPGILDNEKSLTSPPTFAMGFVNSNQYYDINLFFNNIFKYGEKNPIPDVVRAFMSEVVPSREGEFAINEYVRLKNHANEFTTPAKILKSAFFDEFRVVKPVGGKRNARRRYNKMMAGPFRAEYSTERPLGRHIISPRSFAMPDDCFMRPDSFFFQRLDGKPETLLMNQLKAERCPHVEPDVINDERYLILSDWLGDVSIDYGNWDKDVVVKTIDAVKRFVAIRAMNNVWLHALGIVAFNHTVLLKYGDTAMTLDDMSYSTDDAYNVHQLIDVYKQWSAFMVEQN